MELPQLQDLWSEVSAKRGDEVVFLCVNRGDAPEVIETYWKRQGFNMRAVRQRGSSAGAALGVLGYPTLYLIDTAGRVRYRASSWDPSALRKALLGH